MWKLPSINIIVISLLLSCSESTTRDRWANFFNNRKHNRDKNDDGNNRRTPPPQQQQSQEPEPRVVGGNPADQNEYEFFASWAGTCGAALVHRDILVTAAHCVSTESDSVVVNAHRLGHVAPGQSRVVTDRLLHPKYNGDVRYDFAVLKLDRPTHFTPIPINTDRNYPQPGHELTIIGMGRISEGGYQPSELQEAVVPVIANGLCETVYNNADDEEAQVVFEAEIMLCGGGTGQKDACQGDSGGPAISTLRDGSPQNLIGIVSWGSGCARPGFPGVYARVSTVADWIHDMVCVLSSDPPSDCPQSGVNGVVLLTMQTDNFPEETLWDIRPTDAMHEVVASESDGTYHIDGGYYYYLIQLEEGRQYTLTFGDTFGDGFCCTYGTGFYQLTHGNYELASGGSFATTEATPFTVPAGNDVHSVHHCDDTNVPFLVDAETGEHDCDWLSVNLQRYGYLCQFVDVASLCPMTCDYCELFT